MGLNDQTESAVPWWRDAVTYQIYPRSFADGNGDGIGDLPGITSRLPYLRDLGVDAVWLSPFYTSPQNDAGYDVADYCDIDPLFGTLADADALLETAHALGLKVIVDLVPNHTSSEHAWFQAALAAAPGSPERDRYLFRDSPDDNPPNNWKSVFGGSAWTQVDDGQWYLHLFDSSQPDLNWRNPEVGDMFVDVLRFWLDRGADGFRVDVAHGLFKEESLRDQRRPEGADPDRGRLRRRVDGGAHRDRRADVGPARGARRLPALAPGARGVRRRPDVRGRGLDPDPGVHGALHPTRRVQPGLQLRLAARRLEGVGVQRRRHRHHGRGRPGRRLTDLGAQQPRRGPARDPLRRWRGRPGPGPRRDADDARAARLGLRLPGRGARAGAGRGGAGSPAGPPLDPHRRGGP